MTGPNSAESDAPDPIDYERVLAVCLANDEPGRALKVFVDQEREHAAHKERVTCTDGKARCVLKIQAVYDDTFCGDYPAPCNHDPAHVTSPADRSES